MPKSLRISLLLFPSATECDFDRSPLLESFQTPSEGKNWLKKNPNSKIPLSFLLFLTSKNNFIKCLILIHVFRLLLPYLKFVRYLLYAFKMNVVSRKFMVVVKINVIKGAPKEVNGHFFSK